MSTSNPKFYSLPMFPYPSGTAMHVGHVSNFLVNEINARYRKMLGDNVIFPIGYDSFGLPTENYAIKNNKSAHQATAENIKYYNEQLTKIDFAFDPDRKFATSDPEYYKWTQWIFIKLFEHGLVYRKDGMVNWCNGCQTVLANDQVVDGKCERCETEIIQKKHPQWYIKITDYADQLLDYSDCDRPEETKIHQKNWIGRSTGCEADFTIEGTDKIITVFTTRIDTIYGVTAVVLAPENEIIDQYMSDEKKSELANYRRTTALKTNIERQATDKDKTGFDSGVQVIHPLTGELVPVWFADYVLPDYATGAVMFVPAHDERDAEFAHKYGITSKQVIVPEFGKIHADEINIQGVTNILFDPQTQLYGVLNDTSKGDDDLWLITGGMDDAESPIDAARREIAEEVGYHDFSLITPLGTYYSHYYHPKKQDYRKGLSHNFLCVISSHETKSLQLEAHETFEISWVSPQQLLTNLEQKKDAKHRLYFVKKAVNTCIDLGLDTTNTSFEGNLSIQATQESLIDSGQFNGLDSTTAKAKITKHLESIGKGTAKVTYRLRDWSVSRQRYWGSPIPVYNTFEDNQKVPYFEYEEELLKARSDKQTIARQMIGLVVKHPTENKYLLIKRNDLGKYTNLAGGIEQGDTELETARKELVEESGYYDIKSIESLDHEIQYHQFAPHKDVNRYGIAKLYYVELESLQQNPIDPKELKLHTPEWIDFDQVNMVQDIPLVTYIRDYFVFKKHNGPEPKPQQYIDRYNAHNPHPDKTKRIPHLIPESELPVILPLDLPNYKPAGKSPLEDHPSFKYYHAPDGQVYLRECDTLDTFMCSSFYFLRFCDPHNDDQLISPEAAKLMPVDLYVGGKEHTVGHLLYSRFIYKFLQDKGHIACESKEPFRKLVHQGMVHAHDGRKMSKRWGNVVDPMTIINEYGSDTLRVYTMFMGPVEASKNWNPDAVAGVHRFMTKIERLAEHISDSPLRKGGAEGGGIGEDLISITHQTIQGVTEDIELLKFNTAVSKLMILSNAFQDAIKSGHKIDKELFIIFLQLLAPFATKLSDQLWKQLGQQGSIHDSSWPVYDETKVSLGSIDLPIQVNGKVRGTVTVSPGATQEQVMELAQQHDNIAKWLEGQIVKIIHIQDKICNVIVK